MAKTHPPRIPQPEKRRAVGVLEMPPISGHAQRAVLKQGIASAIRRDFDNTRHAMQARLTRITACALPAMKTDEPGSIARFPDGAAGPKRRYSLNRFVGRGEAHIERQVIKRIGMRTLRSEGKFHRDVGLCASGLGGESASTHEIRQNNENKARVHTENSSWA